METLEPRAGFLCNYEVLEFLKRQRDERAAEVKVLAHAKTVRVARLGRKAFARELEDEEIERVQPPDLHTISFEAIKYLEDEVHPMRRQSPDAIKSLLYQLVDITGFKLRGHVQRLTHAECLQMINLAPTTLVALFVIIEDCEARFEETTHLEILKLIKESLVSEQAAVARTSVEQIVAAEVQEEEEEDHPMGDEEEEEFVGEGLGGAGESNAKELDEVD